MSENFDAALQVCGISDKGFESLFTEIALKVYNFPKRKICCSEEDCADFLLSFYPRIRPLIFRYENLGKKFESYLQSCLHWHMKSYLSQRIRDNRKERLLLQEGYSICRIAYDEHVVEDEDRPFAAENPRLLGPFGRSVNDGFLHRRSVKQFMLLALKCADELNDPAIEHISILTGLSRESFFHLVEALRICMRRRIERIRTLQERRTRNYFRILFLLDEKKHCRNPQQAARFDRRIQIERSRYRNVLLLLSRVPKTPSHRDIARILGLPKGSVDSGYHYMKKYL